MAPPRCLVTMSRRGGGPCQAAPIAAGELSAPSVLSFTSRSLPPPAAQNRPTGPRAQLFTEGRYQSVESLLDLMQKVGQEHGGKSRAQVRACPEEWCWVNHAVLTVGLEHGGKPRAQVRTGPGEGRWVSSGVARGGAGAGRQAVRAGEGRSRGVVLGEQLGWKAGPEHGSKPHVYIAWRRSGAAETGPTLIADGVVIGAGRRWQVMVGWDRERVISQ